MSVSRIEFHVFPSVCYFSMLKKFSEVRLEMHESFKKQTYRNRFEVLSPNGIERFVIPLKKYRNNTPSGEIQIDYTQPWQNKMLRMLETNYSTSPYFEYYIDDVKNVIFSGKKYLNDLSLDTIKLLINWLDIKTTLTVTDSFEMELNNEVDLRDVKFGKRKHIEDWNCDNKAYWQVFGNKFVPNLSSLDLLFCEGPLSPNFI